MSCNLFKHKVEVPINYVGADGVLYPYNEYLKIGTKYLPGSAYPCTVQYEKRQLFKCCEVCDCDKINSEEIIHVFMRSDR